MEFRNLRPPTAINKIGIQGIGRDVPVFDHADWMPFADGDCAVVSTGGRTYGTALLLTCANGIGKKVVGDDVVKLRGGLVVPRTPGRAAVDGDNRALITDQKNIVAVVGIDPEILVVITARGSTESSPSFSAIG